MSKHNNSIIAQEVAYVVSEISKMNEEEVRSLYGIELLGKGKVFDPMYNQEFLSIGEWAVFNLEQDDVEYEEHFHSKEYED